MHLRTVLALKDGDRVLFTLVKLMIQALMIMMAIVRGLSILDLAWLIIKDIYQNPFISYNCLHHNSEFAVAGNGTHTVPIFEKLESGMSVRDSLTSALFGKDYEHDDYSTPRIAAVAGKSSKKLALGIIRIDGIEIEVFKLKPGEYSFVSTYETNRVLTDFGGTNFNPQNSKEAAQYIIDGGKFLGFEKPVSAAAAMENDTGFETGYINLKSIS